MPFDSDESDEVKTPVRKIGVKKALQSSNQPSKSEIRNNFEKKADTEFEKVEDYKQQMWELAVQFRSFIENKTLPENKGPIASNLEKEILDKLVQLATDMNEDELQPQGIGSTSLCMLLMRCMLKQRDTINQLSYELSKLDRKVNK